MQPKLVAIAGPWKGLSYPLADGTHIVGRELESDIQLDEAAVSRRHCVIERCGDRCTVRDLKSRNGTFVNASEVTDAEVRPGDKIRVGGSTFVLVAAAFPEPHVQAASQVSALQSH